MLGLICTERNFFYGAVHILPNKIHVTGLLTGRRKRRSEEIVTGIYVPARGAGDPAGPAASAATAEVESVAQARAAGAPRANLPSHLTAGIS